MSHRRFPVDTLPGDVPAALSAEASHHLLRVLRLGVGTTVTVFDGSGAQVEAEVREIVGDAAMLVATGAPTRAEPGHQGHLILALLKPKALDVALRMAVEAGVTHLHVFGASRSVRRPPRLDRWSRLTQAAAQQCGRADLPALSWSEDLGAALAALPVGLTLAIALPGADPVPKPAGPAAIVVGPEGGLTPAELAAATAAGAVAVGLGAWTLRADTAAALAGAWVSAT